MKYEFERSLCSVQGVLDFSAVKSPVGELATRIHELENIRSFLTGTALTVVMDAVFSVVYIVVMAIYSPVLTLVALATIPLFALVNLMVSPMMRRQLK